MAQTGRAAGEQERSGTLRLRVVGPDGERTVELAGARWVVGSGPQATLRLNDPKVAPRHALLVAHGGSLLVSDLESGEGTYIDGAQAGQEAPLGAGETLQVGDTRLCIVEAAPLFEKGGRHRVPAETKDTRNDDDRTQVVALEPLQDRPPERRREPLFRQSAGGAGPRGGNRTDEAAVAAWKGGSMQEARKIKGAIQPRSGPSELDQPGWGRSAQRASQLHDYAAKFLSAELPAALRPTKDNRRLAVALVWGKDQFLDVRDATPGKVITAGAHGATLQVFHETTMGAPLPIIQSQPDGEFRVLLPGKADAHVRVNGQELTTEQLVAAGKAQALDVPVKGASYVVGLDDRVAIEFGNVQIIARYCKPGEGRKRPLSDRLDLNFATNIIMMLLCAIAFERMIAITDFSKLNLSDDLFKNKDRFAKYIAKADVVQKKTFKELSGVKEGAKAKDDEGKFGKKEADKKEADPSKKGSPVVDVNKREEDRKKVMKSGLIALLGGAGMGDAASNVFGPGGIGTGLNNALGGIKGGAGMGDAQGVGGLGARGGGAGGGGTGLGIGGLGRAGSGRGAGGSGEFDLGGRGKDTTRFIPGKTTILGGLSQEVVGRIIRRHWNEIKYCYEKELAKDPNLAGKVAIYFEIGPVGDVSTTVIRETTLGNSEAENCMLGNVKRWKFPAPQGGGIVQVTYPFIFQSAQ